MIGARLLEMMVHMILPVRFWKSAFSVDQSYLAVQCSQHILQRSKHTQLPVRNIEQGTYHYFRGLANYIAQASWVEGKLIDYPLTWKQKSSRSLRLQPQTFNRTLFDLSFTQCANSTSFK